MALADKMGPIDPDTTFVDFDNPPDDPRLSEEEGKVEEAPEVEKPAEKESKAKDEEAPKKAEPKVSEVKYSEIDKEAMKMGWVPKDEMKDSDKEFIDSKEYIARQPLYEDKQKLKKALKGQSKNIDELKSVVKELSKSMKDAESKGYESAMESLKQQRFNAMEEGDTERFKELDEKYLKAREELVRLSQDSPEVEETSEAVKDFQEKHSAWYQSTDSLDHIKMTEAAVEFSNKIVKLNPSISVDREMELVDEFIGTEFPDYFSTENPNRDLPASVAGSQPARSEGESSSPSLDDLNSFQKNIYNTIKKENPKYTVEEYIAAASHTKEKPYTLDL